MTTRLRTPALVVPREVRPLSADSEHDARERSAAELDAHSATQALGCCKHESSSRAAGVRLPLPDKGSRDDRAGSACTRRHERRSRHR